MKIISIGDVHGRPYWKEINPHNYDKIIFVGDYVDSFEFTDTEILNNLLDIIAFKNYYQDKVELLLGNHDVQYMFLSEGFQCSGYRPTMAASLKHVFMENKKLFQMGYQIDNYIWTHAGITEGWYDYNKNEIDAFSLKFDSKNLADTFNKMMYSKENRLLHQVGRKRGGAYNFGGITWADRNETMNFYLAGFHQIVGHTPIDSITKFGDEQGSIRYIDVLGEIDYIRETIRKEIEKYGESTRMEDEKIFTKFYELEI